MHKRLCCLLLVSLMGVKSLAAPAAATTTTTAANASEPIAPELRVDESELTQYVEEQHSQAEEDGSSDSDSGNGKGLFKISLLPQPKKSGESVNLEYEGIPSKILSTYDKTQQKITGLTEPLPILDTISEHEKYGNHGDMFGGLSRSIVNSYEAFSNFLNTLIQKPKEIARSISKSITAQLDIIGGKIVGL